MATSVVSSRRAKQAGPTAVNLAVREMEDRFLAQNASILKARDDMLAMQSVIRVCISSFRCFDL